MKRKMRIIALGIAVISIILFAGCDKKVSKPENYMDMTFFNIGKADCILIRMNDCIILNDAGDTDDYSVISRKLDEYGITDIDYMILSHYDTDHIGSANNVIENYNVKTVIGPDYVRDSKHYNNLMKSLDEKNIELTKLQEDYFIEEGNGKIWVNIPEKDYYDDDNNYSLITAVYFGNNNYLLAGDAMKERLAEFNSVCTDSFSLMKIPHHGEYNKSISNFINNNGSDYAVVTTDVMENVEQKLTSLLDGKNIDTYYTFNGNVIVETDGTDIKIEQK